MGIKWIIPDETQQILFHLCSPDIFREHFFIHKFVYDFDRIRMVGIDSNQPDIKMLRRGIPYLERMLCLQTVRSSENFPIMVYFTNTLCFPYGPVRNNRTIYLEKQNPFPI